MPVRFPCHYATAHNYHHFSAIDYHNYHYHSSTVRTGSATGSGLDHHHSEAASSRDC